MAKNCTITLTNQTDDFTRGRRGASPLKYAAQSTLFIAIVVLRHAPLTEHQTPMYIEEWVKTIQMVNTITVLTDALFE